MKQLLKLFEYFCKIKQYSTKLYGSKTISKEFQFFFELIKMFYRNCKKTTKWPAVLNGREKKSYIRIRLCTKYADTKYENR